MSGTSPSPWPTPRSLRLIILGLSLVCALVIGASGVGRWAENAIGPFRFAVAQRPASGQVVIVEMDAASIATFRRWPWSRQHHAAVVDQLRRAGAGSITFDVDFSSSSDTAGDRAFARALERSPGLVALPTFGQAAGAGDTRSLDALPLPAFRPHVGLASVSVAPDTDGIVRRMPFGTFTAGTPRPSLAAWIAHRSGAADAPFPIAFEIDPGSIPRLSFLAIRNGRFDPAVVRGRDVLIGATAIEMGDRYATPSWGVMPGVVIQALAAETLLRGLPQQGSSLWLVLLALGAGAALLRANRLSIALTFAPAAVAILFAIAILAQSRLLVILPLAPALAAIGVIVLGRVTLHLLAQFDQQRCTDDVTGLPNRLAMVRAYADHPGRIAVVLLSNIESLLAVLGAAAERDLVLRLADRVRLAAEGAEPYRLSDRLLAVALPTGAQVGDLAARVRTLLLQPVEVSGRRVDPAVHIGLAVQQGTIADRLTVAIRAAEEALEAGDFFRDGAIDRAALADEVSLMGDLDLALAAGDVAVHYQPKLALAEGRITSVEALVRWHHPSRGYVRPDRFVTMAEQSDRIGPLTHYILRRVVDDLAAWQAAGLDLGAAINVSARLVADDAFGAALEDALLSSGVTPSRLTLEVTESATLADPERAAAALRRYRELGCGISMDDYGTGQSTLSYLQRLPLSELKIDRSFVQHAHENPADALMVRSTIDLAHGLGLKVVAEGIEDAGCLAFLRAAGCDMAQGYHISRPVPRAELEQLLWGEKQAA